MARSNPFHSRNNPTKLKTIAVTGSRDEFVRMWDVDRGKCLHSIHAHKGTIWAVAIAVRGNGDILIVTTSDNGAMRSWNGRNGKKLVEFNGHRDKVLSLVIYDPTGMNPVVFSAGSDKSIRAWDLLTGNHIRAFEGHDDEIHCIAVEGYPGINAFHHAESAHEHEHEHEHDEQKSTIIAHPIVQGKTVVVASASKDLSIRIWDFRTGHVLFELLGHTRTVYEIGITKVPDNYVRRGEKDIAAGTPIVVSSGDDGTVRVWNLTTGKNIRILHWHRVNIKSMDVKSFKYSHEGHNSEEPTITGFVASCGWDKTVQIHSVDEALTTKESTCCQIS